MFDLTLGVLPSGLTIGAPSLKDFENLLLIDLLVVVDVAVVVVVVAVAIVVDMGEFVVFASEFAAEMNGLNELPTVPLVVTMIGALVVVTAGGLELEINLGALVGTVAKVTTVVSSSSALEVVVLLKNKEPNFRGFFLPSFLRPPPPRFFFACKRLDFTLGMRPSLDGFEKLNLLLDVVVGASVVVVVNGSGVVDTVLNVVTWTGSKTDSVGAEIVGLNDDSVTGEACDEDTKGWGVLGVKAVVEMGSSSTGSGLFLGGNLVKPSSMGKFLEGIVGKLGKLFFLTISNLGLPEFDLGLSGLGETLVFSLSGDGLKEGRLEGGTEDSVKKVKGSCVEGTRVEVKGLSVETTGLGGGATGVSNVGGLEGFSLESSSTIWFSRKSNELSVVVEPWKEFSNTDSSCPGPGGVFVKAFCLWAFPLLVFNRFVTNWFFLGLFLTLPWILLVFLNDGSQ